MKLGKREQIVIISIAALCCIGLVHLFVFAPHAREFADTQQSWQQNRELLQNTALPDKDSFLRDYGAKTEAYKSQVSSVTEELKLTIPQYYKSNRPEAKDKRLGDCTNFIRQLLQKKQQGRAPKLTFLNDRRQNPNNQYEAQMGWNIPDQIPGNKAPTAIWETVGQLKSAAGFLGRTSDLQQKLNERINYNSQLQQIGINPAEVCNWFIPYGNGAYVFFDSMEMAETLLNSRLFTSVSSLQQMRNPLSTNRFGVLVPNIKKLWISELVWETRDQQNPQMTKEELRTALDVNMPTDHPLLATNKQLEALLDIISKAEKNGVTEIQKVNLMKPVGVGKQLTREQAAKEAASATPTPAPAAGPGMMGPGMMGPGMMGPGMMPGMMGPGMGPGGLDPAGGGTFGGMPGIGGEPGMGGAAMMGGMMGMPTPLPDADKIGGGTGIEMWFTGDNAATVGFLFDLTHTPRTYSIDDLDMQALPNGTVYTSATVELLTDLKDSDQKK